MRTLRASSHARVCVASSDLAAGWSLAPRVGGRLRRTPTTMFAPRNRIPSPDGLAINCAGSFTGEMDATTYWPAHQPPSPQTQARRAALHPSLALARPCHVLSPDKNKAVQPARQTCVCTPPWLPSSPPDSIRAPTLTSHCRVCVCCSRRTFQARARHWLSASMQTLALLSSTCPGACAHVRRLAGCGFYEENERSARRFDLVELVGGGARGRPEPAVGGQGSSQAAAVAPPACHTTLRRPSAAV